MIDFIEIAMVLTHAAASFVALALSLCNVNRMGPETCHGVRLAVVMVATGAFASLVADLIILRVPGIAEWFLMLGVAGGLAADRRNAACPCAFKTLHANRTGHRQHG